MRKRLIQAFAAAEEAGCICPVCGASFHQQDAALRCANGHTVNANRRGYFHFLNHPVSDVYHRELFESRRRILEAGFYRPLVDLILQDIPPETGTCSPLVLDVGCGDGYYIRAIRNERPYGRFAGVDLSKEAIETASDGVSLWCVADMRHLPFSDGSVDVLLNILSPADYREFRRVLKPDGCLIKVTPGPGYLGEIRERRGLPRGQESSSDAYLSKQMKIIKQRHFLKTVPVSDTEWADFVRMTPLNQDLDEAEISALAGHPGQDITLDLNILTARP